MIIADLMTRVIASVASDDSLASAVALMNSNHCSCVPVIDDQQPVGIITERDVVRVADAVLHNRIEPDISVAEIMTPEPVSVKSETSLYDALLLARSRKLRHLLVLDDNEPADWFGYPNGYG